MRVLNFGSLNIDHVYRQSHIVRPGETLSSQSLHKFAGGKGANQSAALGKAGVDVCHAGKISPDAQWLLDQLTSNGVDCTLVDTTADETGHAIIQVDDKGENSIVLFGGGNQSLTESYVERVVSLFTEGDILLLQNEINCMPEIMSRAHSQGMDIYFNPAPFDEKIHSYPLELVSCFVVNETEAQELSGLSEPQAMIEKILLLYPHASIILTLGSQGVIYACADQRISVDADCVEVVDTTAAGDTFIGYFVASMLDGLEISASLKRATRAAGIAVSRSGAMESVPSPDEL
ncbi:MAG: ribokinase [Planctomycetes bacterium]|nr:ribokinase [Planctomycetota bacterium]